MIGFFIALISGVLMSVQGVFNTQVTKASSIWAASAFVQLSALIVCLGAWLFTDRSNLLQVFQVQPKVYARLAGRLALSSPIPLSAAWICWDLRRRSC